MTAWYDYPVTHGYTTAYEGPGTDTPHEAFDLGTPFHTPLTAPTSGTVLKADYQSWGGEIFVQPDNKSLPEWYMYHPDELEVHAGQHVNAGQEIALSGGENPGYPGAEHPADPQWSTGPHTHIGWWTKWITTPDGVRPYGPDPSNLIDMAAHGGGSSSPVPSNIYNAVEPYAQSNHVPDPIWETVAYMESSFNPNAANGSSGNEAVGLFQLLENAGQGAGYNTAQLQNPSTNAQVGMQYIGEAWKNLEPSFNANSLQWWEEFAAQSGHPGGSPNDAYTQQVAQQMMQDYKQFTGGSSTAMLSDNTSSSGSQCIAPPIWNIGAWPGYWACQAQSAASGSAQSAIAGLVGWIGASTGPLLLRVGVGITGIALVWIGTNEIVAGLKGESGTELIQENATKGKEAAAPNTKKSEKKEQSGKKAPTKERKPKADKPKPEPKVKSTEATEGTGGGLSEAATTAAEVAV